MRYYRLYFRKGGPGSPISGVEEFEARDDFEAFALSEEFAGDHAMELWSGTRMVRLGVPAARAG